MHGQKERGGDRAPRTHTWHLVEGWSCNIRTGLFRKACRSLKNLRDQEKKKRGDYVAPADVITSLTFQLLLLSFLSGATLKKKGGAGVGRVPTITSQGQTRTSYFKQPTAITSFSFKSLVPMLRFRCASQFKPLNENGIVS
jgi:hypothetical protein